VGENGVKWENLGSEQKLLTFYFGIVSQKKENIPIRKNKQNDYSSRHIARNVQYCFITFIDTRTNVNK
jgi:hypothetical protein